MFNLVFEKRLSFWKDFRKTLENSETPIEDSVKFFQHSPLVSRQADPYDKKTWPNPWEMIHDNFFCSFVKILGICYTLQLTERFSAASFKIHITHNKENIFYLLQINELCIMDDEVVKFKDIVNELEFENTFDMPMLQ